MKGRSLFLQLALHVHSIDRTASEFKFACVTFFCAPSHPIFRSSPPEQMPQHVLEAPSRQGCWQLAPITWGMIMSV